MINERILEFLDGSLSHEEEAELLHTLSVSPEKRELLRSYMNQGALFARDKQTISVPYAAEQALWQRMAAVLPAVPTAPAAIENVAVPIARNVGFFTKVFNTASTAVAGATLVVGLVAGYLLRTDNTIAPVTASASKISTLSTSTPQPLAAVTPEIRYITKYVRIPCEAPLGAAAESHDPGLRLASFDLPALPASDLGTNIATLRDPIAERVASAIANKDNVMPVAGRLDEKPVLLAVGGDDGIKPYFHETQRYQERPKTLLERFEFGVTEHFGREYPNSTATNSSMPIITNSSINTFFQISPKSPKFWAGAAFGTANVTKKSLYTRSGNQLDRLQDVLVADTVHSQSTYIAGFLQYRVPAFVGDMTFTAGYGLATLGQMFIGEIGMHYDLSREVGLQVGIRGMQFHYSLAAERAAAVNSGSGSLVIPKGVEDAPPSFNLELGTGLYFHF